MKLAPIVLFTYNRPRHARQTIEALQKNELANESELFIYSDGAKNETDREKVNEVRTYIKNIDGFKKVTIIERDKNWGLANNIIDGVTKIVNEYGKIIVLEDDLVTSPYFLKFMNEALELYANENKVSQVVGYSYFEKYIDKHKLDEILFIRGADCLGWATWVDRWKLLEHSSVRLIKEIEDRNLIKEFNWNNSYDFYQMLKAESEGKVNSWAIRWYASMFLLDKYALYPSKSLVLHIGNDGYGTNYTYDTKKDPLNVPLYLFPINLNKVQVFQTENSRKAYIEYLSQYKSPLYRRVLSKILPEYMKKIIKSFLWRIRQ
jgi:hypothetical protein